MPDKIQALREAKDILMPLAPSTSSEVETVGLWADVHKRLWEEVKEKADLDQAIRAYERGYFLKKGRPLPCPGNFCNGAIAQGHWR